MNGLTRTDILRRLARQIVAIAMLFAASHLFASGAAEPTVTAAAVVSSIDYMEGEVTVNGVPAQLGMKLESGATVSVGPDSTCDVVFGHNVIRVYAETSAVIDTVARTVAVSTGAIGAVFDKLQELGSTGGFRFDTPTAVGGVRGTVFYVRVESQDSTFVCVCNGTVDLTSAEGGDSRLISAEHYSGLRFLRGADGSIASEVPEMAYHTDEAMADIAARVGSTIDWTRVD